MNNNLGDYKWLVIEAKKAGGPKVLCAQMKAKGVVIGLGVAAFGVYLLYKKFYKKPEKYDREMSQNILANAPEYQVVCDAEDESGTVFHRGEQINIIYKEKDVALI